MKLLNNPSRLSLVFLMVMLLVFKFTTFANAQNAYESAVLADHPIGFWPLDFSVDTNTDISGNYIATDLSGNTNNGTYIQATPSYEVSGPTPYITNAVAFDDVDYVDLSTGSNTALLNFGGFITMEAWVQPAAVSLQGNWGDIIAKGYDSSTFDELTMRVSGYSGGGNFYAGTYGPANSGNVQYSPGSTNWTYLVSSWDGTNWNIYINGQLAASAANTLGAFTFNDPWAIGNGTSGGNGRIFQGSICQVALYTNALTPTQIHNHYLAGTYGSVTPPPQITAQPSSRTVYVGANVFFGVSTVSSAQLSYQWYQIIGGVTNTLSGQTNAYMVLSNAQLANSGATYGVQVMNVAGSTNSAPATLTVQSIPNAYASTVMADQPVAYYPLNETSGTTAFEYGGGGLNGTYENSPILNATGPSSYIPSTVTFDGASTYVNLGDTPLLNFGGQITMEAWVLPTSPQAHGPINGWADVLAKGNDGSLGNEEMKMRLTYGYQGGTYTNNVGDVDAVGPTTTNWTHLVCTWNGTNWNLYANGQLIGTKPDAVGALNFADPWAIANGTVSGNGRLFSGDICEAAIYSHALTPAKVVAHYLVGAYGGTNVPPVITAQPISTHSITNTAATFTVTAISSAPLSYQWWKGSSPVGQNSATLTIGNAQLSDAGSYTVVISNIFGAVTSSVANLTVAAPSSGASAYESLVLNDNPAGYWPLDLSVDTGSSATDLSGNGNNGSYVNISSSLNKVPGPSQYISNSASFDGGTAYVDLSTGTNTGVLNFGGQITIEAWVEPAALQTNSLADILAKGIDTNLFADELQMRLQNNNAFGSGSTFVGVASPSPSGTNWTYLVSTWDGANWNLYVNGFLVGTNADVVGAFPFNDPWAIGNGTAGGNSRFFAGNICQVALYAHALTPKQISNHYFMGLLGTTNAQPVFVQQPASQSVFPGSTVTFSFQADSPYPLTNQWYEDGMLLPGQTNATLVLTNVQISNAGDYSVVIGNSVGSTNSNAAHLDILTTQSPSTISWQSPQEISGASDVNTQGTYFGSWAPWDGGANSEPVNGVTFQGNSDLSGLNDWGSAPGGKGGGPYYSSPNTANANYNSLLTYGQYGGDGYSYVVDWSGMTPGHTYLLEFWVEDARSGATGPRWETLSGGAVGATSANIDTSAEIAYSNPLGSTPAGNPGSYIIGTFAANTNGSEEILVTPGAASGSASAQVNLMLVRDVTGVAPTQPHVNSVYLSGTTLVINGNNGTTGQPFIVLTSTNLLLPLSQWTPVTTNTFTGSSFSVTNTVNPGAGQGFYSLQVQ